MRFVAWTLSTILGAGLGLAAPANAASTTHQANLPPKDPYANETKAERDKRMHWWRQARFGMFIHWGLYAVPAGTWNGKQTDFIGEWIMNSLKIPVADYAALAKEFNPVQFNADQWASIAKNAGMKYVVITAKHHDGFAMFKSADPYNIYDATPFHRDPIAELAAACRRQGLKFGVYYSQAQDWHHAGGAAYGGHWDKAQDGSLHEYVQKVAVPQVKELLTRYHPSVLWWDTPVDMSDEDVRALTAPFAADPDLIANNRLGNGVPGDTETPEQYIPATGFPGRDWETCMTMNDTWGYKSFDHNFKSTTTLLRNLIDIASKGGNYLLNVGPDAQGLIPTEEVARLNEIGGWLKRNGRSIYKSSASPYRRLPFDGRATVQGKNLYLHVFTWPANGLTLAGLKTEVADARDVATGERLTVDRTMDGVLHISKPKTLDPIATVVQLSLRGTPEVTEPEILLQPDTLGIYRLGPDDAQLNGASIKAQGDGDHRNIGYWTDGSATAEWKISVPEAKSGRYTVSLEYACEPGSEGSTFTIQVDGVDSPVAGTVAKTASWEDFQAVSLTGVLTLSAGKHTLRLVPKSKPGLAVMNLRRLTVLPVAR